MPLAIVLAAVCPGVLAQMLRQAALPPSCGCPDEPGVHPFRLTDRFAQRALLDLHQLAVRSSSSTHMEYGEPLQKITPE